MSSEGSSKHDRSGQDDLLTVGVTAAASFVSAIALHEHLGHATMCALTTCDLTKMGAFYVDYRPGSIQGSATWLVPVAGPVVSLLAGVIALAVHRRLRAGTRVQLLLWHFFTTNLMIAAGYCLFSGISGRGDLGTSVDEALHNADPAALWQILLIAFGAVSYFAAIKISVSRFAAFIGGGGEARVTRAQQISLVGFLAGVACAVVIGLLNPEGVSILLVSALMSSVGGTSGMGWMMLQFLDRKHPTDTPPQLIRRSLPWIAACLLVIVLYAAVFGPTLNV